MPHNFDFSKLNNIKTLEVNPQGWVTPLYIEYTVTQDANSYNGIESYFWRVKGTQHVFVIPLIRMDYLSAGDYKKHFENALETFREDYIDWKTQGFITEWSREYARQFSKFIIV